MIGAILFDSDAEKYNGFYGDPIRDLVLGSGVLQASQRHMKVAVGDVLIYSNARTWSQYDQLTNRVYFSHCWRNYVDERLTATFRKRTVYALTFENITSKIMQEVHRALRDEASYLGQMQIDYSYPIHLALFRNSMISKYRIEGRTCSIFYSMGDLEKDEFEAEAMKGNGFHDVSWEDRGGHKTIFDEFDSIKHFERVVAFQNVISATLSGGEDEASELVMMLEDLNPKLFDALGAAVKALRDADTDEDFAQVSLSGRRYLEKLADVLFPARDEKYNGRSVTASNYKNRLWAFISDSFEREDTIQALGTQVNHLVREFNAGLHSNREKERVTKALTECATMTRALLAADSEDTRKPYFAYQDKIDAFLHAMLKDHL